MEFKPSKKHSLKGVGGPQQSGQPLECVISFNSLPGKEFSCDICPVHIKGENNFLILGKDFMSKFDCTVFDWKHNKVKLGGNWVYLNSTNSNEYEAKVFHYKVNEDLNETQCAELKDMLAKHKSVFAHNPKSPRACNTDEHVIYTKDARVVKDKIRPLPSKWKDQMLDQANEMLQNNIIRPSHSPHNSNVLPASKKDGSMRFCIDFRTLNNTTTTDSYPLPNVNEILDGFHGSEYFTQLDLASGYWGIPLREEDKCKTAFSLQKGKYEFERMPFGLVNAQATFQRVMDKVVHTVKKRGYRGVEAYVDNIIIHHKSFHEHIATINEVLRVLEEFNLSLRADKCEFAFHELEYLGYIIGKNGVSASPGNVAKISEFPIPKNRKEVQRFLGLTNFNRRFIKNYAEVTAPLSVLTSSKVNFRWGEIETKAFNLIRDRIKNAPSLSMPDWDKPFCIRCDASGSAVGAVLFQINQGAIEPIAYHSKALNKAERNWSATDKELFAIVSAARKWPAHCSSSAVKFYTDHMPLKYIRAQKDPRGKRARWLMELESYNYTIDYISGPENAAADAMSRINVPSSADEEKDIEPAGIYLADHNLDLNAILEAQRADNDLESVRKQLLDDKEIKKGPFKRFKNISIDQNSMLLMKGFRYIIPRSLTNKIIQEYHCQQHVGIENTIMLLRTRFYWKGLSKEVHDFVTNCRVCRQCKHLPNPRAPLNSTQESASVIFNRLDIDVASMVESPRGFQYFLIMVDPVTKFCATAAMADQTALTIERAIWSQWMAYFGIPKELLSDQYHSLDGKHIRDLCRKLAIKKLHSSPYHPEGNSHAERTIGSIKTIIRSICCSRKIPITDWDIIIPEAQLILNNMENKSRKFSPFKMTLGREARLPADNYIGIPSIGSHHTPELIQENARLNRIEAQQEYKKRLDRGCLVNDFKVGDEVLIKRDAGPHPKAHPKWLDGPYHIDKKVGPVNFLVKNSKG